jgi:hypothetical protein
VDISRDVLLVHRGFWYSHVVYKAPCEEAVEGGSSRRCERPFSSASSQGAWDPKRDYQTPLNTNSGHIDW